MSEILSATTLDIIYRFFSFKSPQKDQAERNVEPMVSKENQKACY